MSTKKEKQEITVPTAEEVGPLTDRLVEIEREIKKLTAEKKGIEARLEAYALAQTEEHESLKDGSREGRKVTLSGQRFRLPVVFSSDLLIKSFPDDGAKHKELLEVLGQVEGMAPQHALKLLFSPPCKWETRYDDGTKFRRAALEFFGPDLAPKIVAACRQTDRHGIAKSNTSFDFKAAAEVTAES